MSRSPVACALIGALASWSCGEETLTEGLDQPFGVRGAQFIRGELPGAPPGSDPESPRATSVTTEVTFLRPGLAGVDFFGWATLDTVAVNVRLERQGDGYWVLPAGPEDPRVAGTRTWNLRADLHGALPPGRHRLLVAATDAQGRAGTQTASILCINRPVPDNRNACDPRRAPPELVISLAWDRPVDLDLIVVTPSGDVVESGSPSIGLPEGERVNRNNLEANSPGVGFLDRDSNLACVVDGRHLENVVFQESPPSGTYQVYVNLNETCGEPSVRYSVAHYTRGRESDGTFSVIELTRTHGTLLALQANGGGARGTFVTELVVP